MAINKTVNKSTKTHGAMRNCMEYVLRERKINSSLVYVSGPFDAEEITYDTVYRSFLEEKKLWNKDSGRMYAHNVISWHKDEEITPEEAYEFGKEFVEQWFAEFQTLMAVHVDRNHIHLHMVTNTVSYIDGHKLHTTKNELEEMKQLTNRMCEARGWSTPEKGKNFYGNDLEWGMFGLGARTSTTCYYIMPRKATLPPVHWQYWKLKQMLAVRMILSEI